MPRMRNVVRNRRRLEAFVVGGAAVGLSAIAAAVVSLAIGQGHSKVWTALVVLVTVPVTVVVALIVFVRLVLDRPQSKHYDVDREEVVRFWTEERQRRAWPM